MTKAATAMKSKTGPKQAGETVSSRLIDGRIKELGDWRGEMLARVRGIIRQAEPEAVEEWKWRGVPVWSRGGIICTGETSSMRASRATRGVRSISVRAMRSTTRR
jgi:hypothetical protein